MPIKLINKVFVSKNLQIVMSWDAQSKLNVKKENIEIEYGFNAMSDGERSAFIIAACVILASQGDTVFLDEPERHLHRSISNPLISYLRQIKPHIKWVISTHDLSRLCCTNRFKDVFPLSPDALILQVP
jgi:AAA15 family ATPase/GTPase